MMRQHFVTASESDFSVRPVLVEDAKSDLVLVRYMAHDSDGKPVVDTGKTEWVEHNRMLTNS